MYDFDKIVDRRGTSCLKYDFQVERRGRDDLLPLWVADMDFALPEEGKGGMDNGHAGGCRCDINSCEGTHKRG